MNGETSEGNGPFTGFVKKDFVPYPPAPDTPPTKELLGIQQLDELADKPRSRELYLKLKSITRSNNWPVNDVIRKTLWLKLFKHLGNESSGKSTVYQGMVKEVFGEGDMAHDVNLPSFVESHAGGQYNLNESGMQGLKRVLCIIGTSHPDITYSPTLYPLVSILLHYLGEEDCYNCVSALLQAQDLDYIPQTKIHYEALSLVLADLVKKYAKRFDHHVTQLGKDMYTILESWLWWIFCDLPFNYLVRVVDCFIMEGSKIFYRVGLAILKLYYKYVVKRRSTKLDVQIEQEISQFCSDIASWVTVDGLLKKAFGIRRLNWKEINAFVKKNEIELENRKTMSSLKDDGKKPPPSQAVTGPLNLQNVGSRLLTADQWKIIWSWLPTRITLYTPKLLFSTSEHGTSLSTFYNHCEDTEPTLLIIKTSTGDIFGAYCPVDWKDRTGIQKNLTYFGTGETFIFTITPECLKYEWVGIKMGAQTPSSAQLFMAGDASKLQVGGGSGVAIMVDENLEQGLTEKCDTFGSPPLVPGKDFVCSVVEVFGFVQ